MGIRSKLQYAYLKIIEYLFYRLANNGIDPYVLLVFLIAPAVWEMENMLFPGNDQIDSRQYLWLVCDINTTI